MSPEEGYCMVMCTSPNDEHAEGLANALVERGLAACVQINPIRSVYTWKGEICREEERLLFIKTRSALYEEIEHFITRNHPYEVPEIVRVDLAGGLASYLAWIEGATG
jgi:periplasmic divalent cation tolerance protein